MQDTLSIINMFCPLRDYNPFRRTSTSRLLSVYAEVIPYLNSQDLVTCSVLSKHFYQQTVQYLWKSPQFYQISHIHSELYMLNRFLSHLPNVRRSTQEKIEHINLSTIQERLYDRVNPDFFRLLILHAPNLRSLNLSSASFFHCRSLPTDAWSLSRLTDLDLSNCPNVTDDMMVTIARSCRNVARLKLNRLFRHKGRGIAAFAAECDHLSTVELIDNTSLGDEGVVALAKFRHIHLHQLDLSGCSELTSTSLQILGKYCAHLQVLSLAGVCGLQLDDLKKLNCIRNKTTDLDLSRSALRPIDIAQWISQVELNGLVQLCIDFEVILIILRQQFFICAPKLTHLVLSNASQHVHISFLYDLIHMLPQLNRIVVEKQDVETGFLLDSYQARDELTTETAQAFNCRQSNVAVEMRIKKHMDNLNLEEW